MSRSPSLDADHHGDDFRLPEHRNQFMSFSEGAAHIYRMFSAENSRVLERILQRTKSIPDKSGRYKEAMEIFYASLTSGQQFNKNSEFDRRRISKVIQSHFGIRQSFIHPFELDLFNSELGAYLCGEKQVSTQPEKPAVTR